MKADTQKEYSFVFKGTLRKIRLISYNICFGPAPLPDDEVEQRLSITSGGGIWLTRYRYGINGRNRLFGKEKIPAKEETIRIILDAIAQGFKKYDDVFVTDVGVWGAELINTEGQIINVSGSLFPVSLPGLSDFIREQFGREDLFLFDENPGTAL